MIAQYGTLSDYFEEAFLRFNRTGRENPHRFNAPVYKGDFLPYNDGPGVYWTVSKSTSAFSEFKRDSIPHDLP